MGGRRGAGGGGRKIGTRTHLDFSQHFIVEDDSSAAKTKLNSVTDYSQSSRNNPSILPRALRPIFSDAFVVGNFHTVVPADILVLRLDARSMQASAARYR